MFYNDNVPLFFFCNRRNPGSKGDERVNEQIHLTVLHTFYVRDHNRAAMELSRLNPHWDDDRIYHETRHIMAAAVQYITYNEFLPMALGEDLMVRYNLTLLKEVSTKWRQGVSKGNRRDHHGFCNAKLVVR